MEGGGVERGSGDCLSPLGVVLGLNLFPAPFEMSVGADSRPSAPAVVWAPLALLPLLPNERLARSDSSASEVLLLVRDILLGDSAMRLDLAAATGLAGKPAMPLSVSTPAKTRLAGEGPPLAASNSAAATGLGGRLGLDPLC